MRRDQWVREYKVTASVDGRTWFAVDEVFEGNFDRDTKVRGTFSRPVRARYVRISPTLWKTHMSMRAGLTVCVDTATTRDDLSPPKPCFALPSPANGTAGDCPNVLESGASCQPKCNYGFIPTGRSFCVDGVLHGTVCAAASIYPYQQPNTRLDQRNVVDSIDENARHPAPPHEHSMGAVVLALLFGFAIVLFVGNRSTRNKIPCCTRSKTGFMDSSENSMYNLGPAADMGSNPTFGGEPSIPPPAGDSL